MGKLGKLFTWFKGSQARLTELKHEKRAARGPSKAEHRRNIEQAKIREARRVRFDEPHYYAFYYPEGRPHNPKMYVGPYVTKAVCEKKIKDTWPVRAGESRKRFKIKRLTADQFEEIWGAPPIPLEEQI